MIWCIIKYDAKNEQILFYYGNEMWSNKYTDALKFREYNRGVRDIARLNKAAVVKDYGLITENVKWIYHERPNTVTVSDYIKFFRQ